MHKWAFIESLIQRLGGGDWKPYAYSSLVITMDAAANITREFSVQLTDAKRFLWMAGLYQTNVGAVMAGTDATYGGALIKFDEVGGFGQMGKGSIPLESFFSRGGLNGEPRELPYPVAFEGAGTIAGTLTNKTGAAMDIQLTFIGIRKY